MAKDKNSPIRMHKLYPRTAQSVDDPLAEIQKLVHSLPEEPEDEIQTPLIALIVRAILHKLDFIEMINEMYLGQGQMPAQSGSPCPGIDPPPLHIRESASCTR